VPWFIKQETFLRPYSAMQPHLAAHRAWVAELRAAGVVISSGYLVDGQGQPGGGGLLVLQAADHADPMVCSGGVDWTLHGWISAVGELEPR